MCVSEERQKWGMDKGQDVESPKGQDRELGFHYEGHEVEVIELY